MHDKHWQISIPPHCCVCPKPGPRFATPYVAVFFCTMDLSQGWDGHYILFNHILMASVKIPLWRFQPNCHESMYNQFDYQQKLCIQKGSHTKANLAPSLCVYWIACTKARKWAIMYLCGMVSIFPVFAICLY